MNRLINILPFVTTAFFSVIATVLYLNWVTPQPLSLAIVDSRVLITNFTRTLDDNLSDEVRISALKRFTQVLATTITDFEQQTGIVVLKKEAVFLPSQRDMTKQISAQVQGKLESTR